MHYVYFYRSAVSGYVLVTLDFPFQAQDFLRMQHFTFYFYRFPMRSFKYWYVTLVFLKLFEMYWLYVRILDECGHHHSPEFPEESLVQKNLARSSFFWFEPTSSFVMGSLGLQLQQEITSPLYIFIFVTFILFIFMFCEHDKQVTFNESILGFCLCLLHCFLFEACDLYLHETVYDSCGILTSHYSPAFSSLIYFNCCSCMSERSAHESWRLYKLIGSTTTDWSVLQY